MKAVFIDIDGPLLLRRMWASADNIRLLDERVIDRSPRLRFDPGCVGLVVRENLNLLWAYCPCAPGAHAHAGGPPMPTITSNEAAKRAGRSRRTIMRAIETREIDAHRDNRNQWQIDEDALA